MNQTARSLCLIVTLGLISTALPAHAGETLSNVKPVGVPDKPLTVLSGTEVFAFRIRLEVSPEEIRPLSPGESGHRVAAHLDHEEPLTLSQIVNAEQISLDLPRRRHLLGLRQGGRQRPMGRTLPSGP